MQALKEYLALRKKLCMVHLEIKIRRVSPRRNKDIQVVCCIHKYTSVAIVEVEASCWQSLVVVVFIDVL